MGTSFSRLRYNWECDTIMARKFITPIQDASIYQQFQSRNTGFDEVLEIGKSTAISGSIRGLIEFDIAGKLSGSVPVSSSFFLNLRIANAEKFKRNQTVEFYHISESWDEGTGFFEQDLENAQDGATWTVKDNSDVSWSLAGGTTGSLQASQSFDFEPEDIRLDISDVVRAWITGTLPDSFPAMSNSISGSIRGLIEFDIAGKLSGSVPVSSSFFLNLRIANAEKFKRNQTVEFYHISESWDEGTGFFEQDLENAQDGATWTVKDNSDVSWSLAGGTTGSLQASQSFDFEPEDIRLDISDVVRAWITGSDNNGLLIKIPTADELNNKVLSNIRFFSRNTHTIYPPTIEAVWNTQTMSVTPNCGLTEAPNEIELFVTNPRPEFVTGSTQRIRFGARTVQPIKSFSDTFRFSNKFFLPSASHIGVTDAATEALIIPFDSGSLLSADGTGSFFDLKVENMYIGRTYKILVQIQKPWGPEVVNTGHTFRVVTT